jgi:integrase
VDLEARTLRVECQLQRKRDGEDLHYPDPKHLIKLPAKAVDALGGHYERRAHEAKKAGGLYRDSGLVFTSELGTPLDASNVVNRSFKPLLRSAGLPSIRFHDLRHTCATLLLMRHVHPKFVQKLLGHKSIAITLDLYSHWIPDMGDFTADAMDDILYPSRVRPSSATPPGPPTPPGRCPPGSSLRRRSARRMPRS